MLSNDQLARKDQWKKLKRMVKDGIERESKLYKKRVREFVQELSALDRKNSSRVKKIIDKHGWPGISLVGKRGAQAAWLLVQHATHDVKFQKKCLNLLRNAVRRGDAEKKHEALLTDRILILENKKQIYGTQFRSRKDGIMEPFPIKNRRRLSTLRKAMGLEPFSIYEKKMRALNLR